MLGCVFFQVTRLNGKRLKTPIRVHKPDERTPIAGSVFLETFFLVGDATLATQRGREGGGCFLDTSSSGWELLDDMVPACRPAARGDRAGAAGGRRCEETLLAMIGSA